MSANNKTPQTVWGRGSEELLEIRWSDFAGLQPSPAGPDWTNGFLEVKHPPGYLPAQPLCRGQCRDGIERLMLVTGTVKGTIPNTEPEDGSLWSSQDTCFQLVWLMRKAAQTSHNIIYHLFPALYEPFLLVIWFPCGRGIYVWLCYAVLCQVFIPCCYDMRLYKCRYLQHFLF